MRRGTRGRGYGGGGGPAASHRPQNNIPRQLQPPQSHGGAMMTGHLQGLKDIDMELELLKRKREIIEQQQQILSNSYRQRNVYEQPMFNQSREDRHDDYASLYDNPRESEQYEGRGGRGEGSRKRPYVPVWEHEAPAKRFSAPSRGVKKSFGSRLGPSPNPPPDFQRAPESRFPNPKPYKRPPPASQKKRVFAPTKVSKPSAAPQLKLASYQPAERKRLVNEAMASGAAQPSAATDDKMILRADREPSHLMIGRLELALGAIMKDVRTANPQHEMLFKQPHVTRAMKQCVRDRIRIAMIGKPVSAAEQIKFAYYEMFPVGSDNDIIMKGLQAQENKPFITDNTVNPNAFFKKNMLNLMILKMEEMTNKLQDIYGSGGNTTSKLQNRQKNTKPKPNTVEPKEDTDGSPKEETQADAKPNTDPETQNDDNIEPKTVGEPETGETQPTQDDETITVEATEEPTINEPETQPIEPEPTEKASNIVSEKAPIIVIPKEFINNEHYLALDRLLNFKMIHLIKRFTPEFVKNMDLDAMYRKTKASIIGETAKKLGKYPKNKSAFNEEALDTSATSNASTTQTPNKLRLPMLYYVKILGKPSLPKRKAMESFFSQFNPKSIKKHRTVHNLLFVGFVTKEPYEQMLAADGTVIGRFTLDIKVSERNDNKKNQKNTNNSLINSETDTVNDSKENIVETNLNEQITDLLTTIRNSESDNFSDDIVMAEPPVTDNAVMKENGNTTKMEELVDCDADQNANNVTEDDVIEFKDVPQNVDDVIEIKDATNNIYDPTDAENDNDDVEINQMIPDNKVTTENEKVEKKDTVAALTEVKEVKATPTRASARLATPGGIKTRRMSKLSE